MSILQQTQSPVGVAEHFATSQYTKQTPQNIMGCLLADER